MAGPTSEPRPQGMMMDHISPSQTSVGLGTKKIRTRATAARPLFGHVKGVYRGKDPHSTLLGAMNVE